MSTHNSSFQDLSIIMQHRVDYLDYLGVYALNYVHVDTNNHNITLLGTEKQWLSYMVEQDLHNQIAPRLRDYFHAWDEHTEHAQAYLTQVSNNTPVNWMKTDFCLKDESGYHLLEIGHTKALGIDTIQQFEDEIGAFQDEAIRLKQKYHDMIQPLTNIAAINDYQRLFDEEDKKWQEQCQLNFDMSLFEPLPEPVLTEEENEAIRLRVMWHQDDEIADKMNRSILDIKAMFHGIKEKYQQPKIPQKVYIDALQDVLKSPN